MGIDYEKSEHGRAVRLKYSQSPAGKKSLRLRGARYLKTAKGRARKLANIKMWNKTEKGLANRARVVSSAKRIKYMSEFRKSRAHRERRSELRKILYARPEERLNIRMRSRMGESLRGKKESRRWQDLAGYPVSALRARLESLFAPGMGWHNIGEWHIDHIRPISSFRYSSPDDPDFRACWALSNLQPLWARDNISKHNRWEG